jgi:hypothetical protein
MKNKLAIAIPTYNRPEILKFNLLQIIDELIQYDIPVYISDDSTNEDTRNLIIELKNKHDLIFYYKNEIKLGHDLNFLNTIRLPKEDYVWYLGDSMIIREGAIKKALSVISISNYDFISCSADWRDLDFEERVFNDGGELFEKLCWHLTLTGATIYNRESIYNLANFDVSRFKNFPQTAFIFEMFTLKKSSLYWINEKLIYSNSQKKSYWSKNIFEVFIDDFKNCLYNLDEIYPLKIKDKVILQHSVKSKVFNFRAFVKYRLSNFFDYKIFIKYKKDFFKYTEVNLFILFIVSIFPISIIKLFLKMFGVKYKL